MEALNAMLERIITQQFVVAIENIAAWVVLMCAAAAVLGGFWALVDTCITYGAARLIRRSPASVADDQARRAELGFATRLVASRKEIL